MDGYAPYAAMDQIGETESISPSGRVQDLRRQWVLHEDEALAHRLQDEEIVSHYAGNRTRNAIVREDGPKARQEQIREEEEALEQRLRHLSLLQRQAEQDALLAQNLAKKYQADVNNSRDNMPEVDGCEIPQKSPPRESRHRKAEQSSLLGACAEACQPSTSRSAKLSALEADEDYYRELQEQRDAELARQVQEELEQCEKDRMMAIEAQDRELARVLYEKDKAKLKRAKERARLKAEALNKSDDQDSPVSTASSDLDQREHSSKVYAVKSEQQHERRSTGHHHPNSPSRRHANVDNNTHSSTGSSSNGDSRTHPPRPEKSFDGPILGFKAHPKKLPPQPQSPSHSSSSRYLADNNDPVPPYMPIHGFNRNSPKRQQ